MTPLPTFSQHHTHTHADIPPLLSPVYQHFYSGMFVLCLMWVSLQGANVHANEVCRVQCKSMN